MKRRLVRVLAIAGALATVPSFTGAQGASRKQENWVPTWGTAQQLVRVATPPTTAGGGNAPPTAAPAANATAPAAPSTSPAQPTAQTAPPATAPVPVATAAQTGGGRGGPVFRVTTLANQTVRMILRTSIGGKRARVKLSNAFGSTPVKVGAAHLARRATEATLVPGTDRALTFGGQSSFTMMPGVVVVSDPVDIEVPAIGDLAVSMYLPSGYGLTHDACHGAPHHVRVDRR